MESADLSFGQYTLPFILTMISMFLFRVVPQIPDRLKAVVTVCLGVALGYLWLHYMGVECTVKSVMDSLFYGFVQGCAAVGIYELQAKARNVPSTPPVVPPDV
uniref:Putative holin n=1 Tax=viral metagenome TaxID=1070528 RepID=A0A6M3LSS7_9ZZZZ